MTKDYAWCAEPCCDCHTLTEKRVLTPFPIGYGPALCCNRCARVGGLVGYQGKTRDEVVTAPLALRRIKGGPLDMG